MRLERLEVRGYRHLRGSWRFGPGLTLVTGPNESGKSTLHNALIHALFGFSPEERGRRPGGSERERRAPWAGGFHGLTLRARDRGGRPVLVAWDFAHDTVTLSDAVTGALLLREQPRRRQDFSLGETLVGMNRSQFRQVCCLFQGAAGPLAPDDSLRTSLQRAAQATGVDGPRVGAADQRLREVLARLGVHAGHHGLVPKGRAAALQAERARLESALREAREGRSQVEEEAAALERAASRRRHLGRRVAALEQASARSAVDELVRRCRRIDRLQETAAARPARAQALDAEARGRVAALSERLSGLHHELRRHRESPVQRSRPALLAAGGALAVAALAGALIHPGLGLLLGSALACLLAARPAAATAARDELQRQIAQSEGELRRCYAAAGVSATDLGAAAHDFADRLRAAERAQDDRRAAEAAAAERRALLAGATRKELARRLETARAALRRHEAAHGRLAAGTPAGHPVPDRVVAEADHRRAQLLERELATRVAEREAALADPAELAHELHAVTGELESLERLAHAVRIARESLGHAAAETHRRVAPHLTAALRRSLPAVTRGRYADATVDEDLQVRLHEPLTGRLVGVEELSRGTRDQVALIQRLELARLLDPTHGRAPLLLDDCFAHFDIARLRAGVDVLAEVATSRQVILFTESQQVIDTITERAGACRQLQLDDPVEAEATLAV